MYKKLKNKYSGIKNIVVDAGYKIPAIAKLLIDDNVIPIMPYKRPMTKYGFFKKFGKKIKSGYWGDWDDLLTEAENKTEM